MSTLDDLLDRADDRRERTTETLATVAAYLKTGLWWVGWSASRAVLGVVWLVAAVFYGVGRTAGACWPAVCWCGRAVRVGWQDARRRPDGPPR